MPWSTERLPFVMKDIVRNLNVKITIKSINRLHSHDVSSLFDFLLSTFERGGGSPSFHFPFFFFLFHSFWEFLHSLHLDDHTLLIKRNTHHIHSPQAQTLPIISDVSRHNGDNFARSQPRLLPFPPRRVGHGNSVPVSCRRRGRAHHPFAGGHAQGGAGQESADVQHAHQPGLLDYGVQYQYGLRG